MGFKVGEIIRFKKEHPCGDDRWKILRTGIDFKVKCLGCERVIMLSRSKFEKSVTEKVEVKD